MPAPRDDGMMPVAQSGPGTSDPARAGRSSGPGLNAESRLSALAPSVALAACTPCYKSGNPVRERCRSYPGSDSGGQRLDPGEAMVFIL